MGSHLTSRVRIRRARGLTYFDGPAEAGRHVRDGRLKPDATYFDGPAEAGRHVRDGRLKPDATYEMVG